MIYIATPYTDDDPNIIEHRVEKVTQYAAYLYSWGYNCFSPITHGHQVQRYLPERLRKDHRFWLAIDMPFLQAATELHVVASPGVDQSSGVRWELDTARAFKMPTFIVDPETFEKSRHH
jgi:hypothetical protein